MKSIDRAVGEARCWIVVASRAAVESAVAGGFVEIGHGKAAPLARMHAGDGVACYSPREHDARGAPLQAFTALGRVADAPPYQLPHDHQPFRRAVHWLAATPAPVRPLIDALGFIRNKLHWGAAFRFGYLRIPADDFARIASAMQVDWLLPAHGASAVPRAARADAAAASEVASA